MHETIIEAKVKHEKVMRALFRQCLDDEAQNTHYALICEVGKCGGRYHRDPKRRQVLDIHCHYHNIG